MWIGKNALTGKIELICNHYTSTVGKETGNGI